MKLILILIQISDLTEDRIYTNPGMKNWCTVIYPSVFEKLDKKHKASGKKVLSHFQLRLSEDEKRK